MRGCTSVSRYCVLRGFTMMMLEVMSGESESESKSNGPPTKCMQGTNNPASSLEPRTPVILACKLHRVPLARTGSNVV
jgi:hypothetical protein